MSVDECKRCKYKQVCKESPQDFSCEDVKRLAQVDGEQEQIRDKSMSDKILCPSGLYVTVEECDMCGQCRPNERVAVLMQND